MALADLWKEGRDDIQTKSLRQLLAFAGEGKLVDDSTCSSEFRHLLSLVDLDVLSRFSVEAVNDDMDAPGLALQDIVNEVGIRLGYEVQHGCYRGKQGESNHDGLWRDPRTGHAIVVEVKSTVVYRISLETIAGYRQTLVAAEKIHPARTSTLIVLGRSGMDTSDLESQIRGSKYAWDIRLISLDALLKMAVLKAETDDPDSAQRLRDLLVPHEYTKLDHLLDLIKHVTDDISVGDPVEPESRPEKAKTGAYVSKLDKALLRRRARDLITKKLGEELSEESRTLWSTKDGSKAVCFAPSQKYTRSGSTHYWFGLHAHQVKFLNEHAESHVAYLCVGAGLLFAPWAEFSRYVEQMLSTDTNGRSWRHVIIQARKDGTFELRLRSDAPDNPVPVSKWFLPGI